MKIVVAAWSTYTHFLLSEGADVWDTHCDTIAEAKKRARYVLSDDYMRSCEMREHLQYSQVIVNGQCHTDYFREPQPQQEKGQ